ncbi:flavodoxin-dependent (E)-4-hydroxy-3-methylbut-2-enyl-diphosphate synthase, partial [Myxococcota bacterium]|nr:flavodoxin-dependent (E)-4-hydroxy-3-methylbut-2-enyl-diphosphate synthase [Myxococcota bacterium]
MASLRQVKVGKIMIGGGAPVVLQSMTNTDPLDADATTNQALKLAHAGCEIVRITVPNMDAVAVTREVRRRLGDLPLVADVHFDHKVALAVAPYVDKIRLNPGTLRGQVEVSEVAKALLDHGTALRIGSNSGSLPNPKAPDPIAKQLCDAVEVWVKRFEDAGFFDIVVSVKATSPVMTLQANHMASKRFEYPLHIGLTEAGTVSSGSVRSAAVLAALLAQKIGDTIRVSLAGDPLAEIPVGLNILRSLGLRPEGGRVIACPTCGRSRIDVAKYAKLIEEAFPDDPRVIAVMGCEVNGPGEAKMADVALVGSVDGAVVYRGGKAVFRGTVE